MAETEPSLDAIVQRFERREILGRRLYLAYMCVPIVVAASILWYTGFRTGQMRGELESVAKELVSETEKLKQVRSEKQQLLRVAGRIKVMASRKPLPTETPERYSRDGYRFYSLWIEADPKTLRTIQHVVYDMNDPSFSKPLESDKQDTRFKASYVGIESGCLSDVQVTVTFVDGVKQAFEFDQCDAIPTTDWDE